METQVYTLYHLVKSEDLNHHGTLYAGRSAEWFVEAGFVAAASLTKPENVVCLRIHGMTFLAPLHLGDVVCFESKVAYAGKTRLISFIQVRSKDKTILRGFITFIHVDLEGKPLPHGITLAPASSEDMALCEEARNLN